jgi:uncharacterized membrane protein
MDKEITLRVLQHPEHWGDLSRVFSEIAFRILQHPEQWGNLGRVLSETVRRIRMERPRTRRMGQ